MSNVWNEGSHTEKRGNKRNLSAEDASVGAEDLLDSFRDGLKPLLERQAQGVELAGKG